MWGALDIAPVTFAFDVATSADGTNSAWLVADNMLYTVDLATGMAKSSGKVEGASDMIRDITAMSKM